ncbi:MAG: DUF1320 family protein [Pseudomonas sp.]|nr:DUF1320 family protein [Pseudomonas sp.]
MNYITASILLTMVGKSELALITGGKLDVTVEPDLLVLIINGGDTSAYSAEQITDSTAANDLITLMISSASKLMNGYLAERYNLPLTQVLIDDSPLPAICGKLAKYELTLSPDEQVSSDRKDAMSQLRDIAKGLVTLGIKDPQIASTGSVRVSRVSASNLTTGFGR